MIFKTQYSADVRVSRKGMVFVKPSRTKQDFAGECDLNNIMQRYALPEAFAFAKAIPDTRQAFYGDVSDVQDYQTSIEIIRNAEEKFASLPSNIRAYFDNNPVNLLQFMQEPEKNYEEGVKLGIFKPKDVDFNQVSSNVSSSDVATATA